MKIEKIIKKHKHLPVVFGGYLVGLVNGLLGAGGGMLAVPLLKMSGLSQKQSHSNSVAVIFPLSVTSAFLYAFSGKTSVNDVLPYIVPGVIGAFFGTILLKKLPSKWVGKIFAIFMIWAGIRTLMK